MREKDERKGKKSEREKRNEARRGDGRRRGLREIISRYMIAVDVLTAYVSISGARAGKIASRARARVKRKVRARTLRFHGIDIFARDARFDGEIRSF